MMHSLFLPLAPQQKQPAINYTSKLFLMGSCFVEHIGDKLAHHKFPTTINSFGILFHPNAILKILERLINQTAFTEQDIFYANEQWQCFEVHSKLNKLDKKEFLDYLNKNLELSYSWLKEASHVVLTYGTAWGYIHKESMQIVANCHKVPQQQFEKKLSPVKELQNVFEKCFDLIHQINPKAAIISTVSPVRHIKDGIVENNRSKAHLISALQQSIGITENADYYPAYEIMMDCLRDYRFYKADLIHPNQIAINFIWDHFMQSWLYETTTEKTIKQVAEIQKGLQHKPFNSNSEAHKKFVASLQSKMELLKKDFPFMEF